jgi:para-nitrobenzyl esterase
MSKKTAGPTSEIAQRDGIALIEREKKAIMAVSTERGISIKKHMWRSMGGSLITVPLVVIVLLLTAACGTGNSISPLQRDTRLGTVMGIDNSTTSGTYAWLGIPYAKPPVGALRWMPPVDAASWSGIRPAQQFGASCAQVGSLFGPAQNNVYGLAVRDSFDKPVGSEDCLTLNIWRPSTTGTKLPVIVYIHGGSNISGYTADPIFNGETLAARAQVVVVTVNYRLGLLGWLDLAQLKTGDALVDSGNFGTLDQIQALKFVNTNIKAFGGDPGNVTVMGESAGAANTWAMLVSPLTEGLVHKAIAMSGGLTTSIHADTQKYANGLLTALVIADGKAADPASAQVYLATQSASQIATYLRAKSSDDLLKVSLAIRSPGNAPFRYIIRDGTVIPTDPTAAILAGNYRHVPVLEGNTAEEGKLFSPLKLNTYDRFTMQYNFDPDAAPTLVEGDLINTSFLPVDTPATGWNAVAAKTTAGMFTSANTASMNTLAQKQPTQVWYYRFDWNQQPAPFNTVIGAAHAMDLPFVFGNFGKSVFSYAFSKANKPGREALSSAMIASIAAFVKTGNPNNAALGTKWNNWPATLVFDASASQAHIYAK